MYDFEIIKKHLKLHGLKPGFQNRQFLGLLANNSKSDIA